MYKFACKSWWIHNSLIESVRTPFQIVAAYFNSLTYCHLIKMWYIIKHAGKYAIHVYNVFALCWKTFTVVVSRVGFPACDILLSTSLKQCRKEAILHENTHSVESKRLFLSHCVDSKQRMTQHTVLVLKKTCVGHKLITDVVWNWCFLASRPQPSDIFGFPSATDRLNAWHIHSNSTILPWSWWKQWSSCSLSGKWKEPYADAVISDVVKGHSCGRTRPAQTTCWIFPLTEDIRNLTGLLQAKLRK